MKVQFKIALIVSAICAVAGILQIIEGVLCFLVTTVCFNYSIGEICPA